MTRLGEILPPGTNASAVAQAHSEGLVSAFICINILLYLSVGSVGLDSIVQALGIGTMDEDTGSIPDSPTIEEDFLSDEQREIEKQQAALQVWLKSLPYECETQEEMQEKLEFIVGRMAVCAETKNWLVLTTWDGVLQCWLLMHYHISKPLRAKLIRLYYELCLLPGIEPRVLRSWADMIQRLLGSKAEGGDKLKPAELQLPWKPLWRALQKELWLKARLTDPTRNVVNILIYLAERCRKYYSAEEIPEMLSTFIPRITQDAILTMIPVLTSFLPPTHTHLYLPALFKIWEAFNSAIIDDRLIELVGELSEKHVASTAGDAGPNGGAEYKDVGIWSEGEWTMLVGKALGSFNVPVGATRGASTTGGYADGRLGGSPALRIRKATNRFGALAKMMVYSMAVDGPVRGDALTPSQEGRLPARQTGYLAGSKALDSLDRLITSTESFFHPSNSGIWTMALGSFLAQLTSNFNKRWKEEEQPRCKTPQHRRLTPAIRRAFVLMLRTPALLAMFSKDPLSMGLAQTALKSMALIEPNLIMPDLLERAYSGLEVVNETHRTTAVLSVLSAVALPLVSEKVWLGGQKHVVPLLELCIPGIDLNDPVKTVCATMFIVAVAQHIEFGDLSMTQSGLSLSSDAPAEEMSMDVDDETRLPDGTEDVLVLSKDEERVLVRESTGSFADWVTSLFRRVLALFENLPEEGGRNRTTGGKQEETILKALKNMIDVVCVHLSDQLFDLVLRLVYDYATTNAKANAVRAFGTLVASLGRAQPLKTIDKFLPYCISQIKEELKHGASSVRTTSSAQAISSDTTLHWNISILRGCWGYDGATLLKHKADILDVLSVLVDRTLNERGYGGTGRLLTRILLTLTGVYPLNSRFVNTDQWESLEFNKDHNLHWGKMYEAKDVEIDWHVPSADEIAFALEILDTIVSPSLDKVVALLPTAATWDNVARNDFCRYLHVCRSAWSGLPTLFKHGPKNVVNPCLNPETEVESLLISSIDMQAGFCLTDPADAGYQKASAARERFGDVVHRAALALSQDREGEDHIDAVLSVAKAIDVYLLDYALSRTDFTGLQKNYAQARDLNRIWPKQKENSRLVFLKRAQVYHSGRQYLHALYRRRSELDDRLILDLLELSLSPYTRVRRHSQSILHNACGYFVRSTRLILPTIFNALSRGTDPDRMKGALYIMYNKGLAAYAIADPKDPTIYGQYLIRLLECQHQEKPSIQKLVNSIAQECIVNLAEEGIRTDAYDDDAPGVQDALSELKIEFSDHIVDRSVLSEASKKAPIRAQARHESYAKTVLAIVEIASRSTTHWRYVQIALVFLFGLLRRDAVPPPQETKLFIGHTTSPHPSLRQTAQKAIIKVCEHIKIRTYSKSSEELWLEEWSNPLTREIQIHNDQEFFTLVHRPVEQGNEEPVFIDQTDSGFLAWDSHTKAYRAVPIGTAPLTWESASQPSLEAVEAEITGVDYFTKLIGLWGQESGRTNANPELRADNVSFIKTIAKMFQGAHLEKMLLVLEPLLWDADRFKQRAGAEILAGLTRGLKHWPKQLSEEMWSWYISRLDRIYAQIKPDTIGFWESVFNTQLEARDPRRHPDLIQWILNLPLDLQSDSAFATTKALTVLSCFMDFVGYRDPDLQDRYFRLFLSNANISFAEMRITIAQNLYMIITNRWRPSYPSTSEFLTACSAQTDPLHIRRGLYVSDVVELVQQLPVWKEERLPPPRVSQSQYDKVGLTLVRWMWISFYSSQAPLMLPYIIPMLPEFFRMTELSDSQELQTHSQAVLYIVSAVVPPRGSQEAIIPHFIEAIESSTAWRIRLNALPTLIVFFYRNLLSIPDTLVSRIMDVLLKCLSDDNVEVREMASTALSGIVRVSQRQSIIPLRDHFVALARNTKLPSRGDPSYPTALRTLHSAILGVCALIESFPYSVEKWMPPLTDVLATHATDPPPISTTIRKCASEFKKTHQDTWHKDQLAFDDDQLQNLSTMLVGTSYYA